VPSVKPRTHRLTCRHESTRPPLRADT
jgi:hypothetical protein